MNHIDILRRCYELAATSPDPSNQNGAVLVVGYGRNDVVLGEGCNSFTPGVEPTPTKLADRDWRMAHIEHAERVAIYSAVRKGIALIGPTLYCPWAPCSDCAKAIVLMGVRRLVAHKDRLDMTPARWRKSVEIGCSILQLAGVELEMVSGSIGGPPVLVNGELWMP